VPPNPPVEQYWSVTAYDRQTHALIRNMPRASRSSQIPDLQKNADGSIDIYFGPAAPAGKDSNWVPTDAARKFELTFRAYAPTKPCSRIPECCRASRRSPPSRRRALYSPASIRLAGPAPPGPSRPPASKWPLPGTWLISMRMPSGSSKRTE